MGKSYDRADPSARVTMVYTRARSFGTSWPRSAVMTPCLLSLQSDSGSSLRACSVRQPCGQLMQEFDVDRQTCATDILELAENLVHANLVEKVAA